MGEQANVESGTRFTRRSATFIGSFTLAARVVERLGAFGQIALIASAYGSSYIADRYFIASIVPLIIGSIAGEALSANILPALVRSDREDELVSGGLWLAAAAMTVVTLVYIVVADLVVHAYAPAGSRSLEVWVAFAPIGALLGLSGYLGGVLTYFERYVWPPFRSAVATVAGFVATGVVLLMTKDLVWVAAAVSFGYALSFLTLLVEVRRVAGTHALSIPTRRATHAAFGLRGGLVAPVLGGLIGGQVFVLLERLLASTIGVGAVSTMSYARGVVFTPVIVAQSIALGLYPGMVRAYEARELAHVRGSMIRGLRATLFLAVSFAAFFVLFASPTTDILLERGALDPADAHRVASAIAAFAPALIGTMLMVFVARIFYAVAYFRAIVWTQVAALAIYAVVALPLRAAWGVTGLALAFGIAEVIGGAFGLVLAGRRVGLSTRAMFVESCAPALGRALLVAAALGAMRLAAGADLLAMVLALIVAGSVGLGVLWHANWPEVRGIKRRLRRQIAS
jgi:putative peptidoglycan lipid II flippase